MSYSVCSLRLVLSLHSLFRNRKNYNPYNLSDWLLFPGAVGYGRFGPFARRTSHLLALRVSPYLFHATLSTQRLKLIKVHIPGTNNTYEDAMRD